MGLMQEPLKWKQTASIAPALSGVVGAAVATTTTSMFLWVPTTNKM